jgi:DNA polymerase elongation subunit (family B)
MEVHKIFSYSWNINNDKENEDYRTEIRIWGLDENNKSVCLIVNDFKPYVYVQVDIFDQYSNPLDIDWTNYNIKTQIRKCIKDTICKVNDKDYNLLLNNIHELSMKKKLFYANIDNKNDSKLYPYFKLSFDNKDDLRQFTWRCKKKYKINKLGFVKFTPHEHNASPILQLICTQNLPSAGWISFKGKTVKKSTYCDYEYTVRYKDLSPADNIDIIPKPYICSFDIEVNSDNVNMFPSADRPNDKIFQISCIFSTQGEEVYKKILLTLGNPLQKSVGKDVIIQTFKKEHQLLIGFTNLINTENPQLIIGYNILGFDLPYMMKRAKLSHIQNEFNSMGYIKNKICEDKNMSWSSSAYKNQQFEYIDIDGRIFVDLLPVVKRNYKFDQYNLKSVSTFFLGETKDPLSVKDIFKCYRQGMIGDEKGNKALGIVGKYCIQDSVLVTKLFEKIQTWVGLCEMAKTCNVPIFFLITQGQQIKVFSQVYKLCMEQNFVVEHEGYIQNDDEEYTGATVFPPIPGLYEKVIPFDFASLYPTTIIAYNIDYSTLVHEDDKTIKDEDCHIIEWSDHVGCEHDTTKRNTKVNKVICVENRRYRFLKSPKGVMPQLLEHLLNTRKKTKQQMKLLKKSLNDNHNLSNDEIKDIQKRIIILDKRQLAYKVSANSMYGSMGVKRGYLPFLPGAMCTTAKGRQSIEKAASVIQNEYNGKLIYGDTDSCYIHFPNLKTSEECWDYSLHIEREVSNLFPKPMKLEFEEAIYWRFFILTKKQYMALSCGRDGKLNDEIEKKGVVLARRDNSKVLKELYEKVIMMIFEKECKKNTLFFIIQFINKLCSNSLPSSYFYITKSVGSIKDYKQKKLPDDEKKIIKRLNDLDIYVDDYSKISSFIDLYHLRCLPAHIQLAEKMKRRGTPVQVGSRLQYIITLATFGRNSIIDGIHEKQYDKFEDPKFQQKYKHIIKIDFLFYLKSCTSRVDQLLEVGYGIKDFVLNQYKFRIIRQKVLEQIKLLEINENNNFTHHKLTFID